MFSDLYVYLIYNIFKMCFDLNTYIMKCLTVPISSRWTVFTSDCFIYKTELMFTEKIFKMLT